MAMRRALSTKLVQSIASHQPVLRSLSSFLQQDRQAHIGTQGLQHVLGKSGTTVRWHSAPAGSPSVYAFNEVKRLSEAPSDERIIIDVREPAEYEAGYIPGAINIPLKSQPDAIFLAEEEFEDRFGFSKPSKEQEVIFYCRSGVRSSAAAQLAQQQGYPKISEYRGSWLDWEKQGGSVAKP